MVVIPQPSSTSAWQKEKGGGKLPTHSNQSPPGFENISSIENTKLNLHLRHWNGDNSNHTLTKLGFELLHAHAQNPFRPARGAISRSNIPLEKSGRRFIFTKQKRPLKHQKHRKRKSQKPFTLEFMVSILGLPIPHYHNHCAYLTHTPHHSHLNLAAGCVFDVSEAF